MGGLRLSIEAANCCAAGNADADAGGLIGGEHAARPHILFIVENITVPQDPRVWREALFAVSRGFRVSVIAPRSPDYPEARESIDGVDIFRHPVLESGSGKRAQLAEYGGALVHELLIAVSLYRRHPFQVIHGANPPDHVFLIGLLFRPLGVKFVFDHHDLAPELYLSKYGGRKTVLYRLLGLMERLSCRTAHAVISTNLSYKRHVVTRHRIDPGKVFIVRNDPDPTQAHRSEVHPKREDASPRLLYVGSINTQDGVDLLVRSLHRLVHHLGERDIRCDILGDGDDLARVKELSDRLGMAPYLHFAGFVRDKKAVSEHISRADICLESAPMNAVNPKSTFIKIMEYMSHAKPIVAFDLPETRYSVGGAAVLVPPNDEVRFAAAIQELMRDPSRRQELGRIGRGRIMTRLNWDRSTRALSEAYARILQRKPGAV